MDAIPDLRAAIADCESAADYVTRDLLSGILDAEEEHVDFLETQFAMIERMGLQNYAQLNSEAAED
jgi:bacterioferritin